MQPLWAETLGPAIVFFWKRQRQCAAMGLKKNENDGPICAMDDKFSTCIKGEKNYGTGDIPEVLMNLTNYVVPWF